MKNKYNAKKTVVDGITFDSRKEAEYYLVLKDRLKRGEIEGLAMQQKFPLVEPFTHKATGKKYKGVSYTVDFVIVYRDKEGELHKQAIEVKSKATKKARDYSLRKKLFAFRYPDIEFLEVGT